MGITMIDDEIIRYSKQLILEGFGMGVQEKLSQSRVLVAGAGGLGSPVLYYLAAAGVGTLGIVDFDTVSLSNLNRQILHSTEDIGIKKTASAYEKINRLNPDVSVKLHTTRLRADNIREIVENYDVVIDATDNFAARFLISDCCFFLGKPIVEGAATGMEGILMTIVPGKSPCYRCLYPSPPDDGHLPSCSNTGILGAVTGIVGSAQALEAIKLITGVGDTLSGRIMTFDAIIMSFRTIEWARNPACPLCGENPSITELYEHSIKCRADIV